MTIGGDTHTAPDAMCSQVQWFWTIDIGDAQAGVKALVSILGDEATPKWVKFDNFGGFDGGYWEGGGGNGGATARYADDTVTITGTAYGVQVPETKPRTTKFEIVAAC